MFVSKHNSNCEKQVILLMIPNGEVRRWHYLAVKKLSALLRGTACFHSFRKKKNLNRIKKSMKKINDFYSVKYAI